MIKSLIAGLLLISRVACDNFLVENMIISKNEHVNLTNKYVYSASSTSSIAVSGFLSASGNTIFNTPMTILPGAVFTVLGVVTVQDLTVQGVIQIYDRLILLGNTTLNVTTAVARRKLTSLGTGQCYSQQLLSGTGDLDCTIYNNGTLSPGISPCGVVYVAGLVLLPESILKMDVQEYVSDEIISNGDVVLGGKLVIDFLNPVVNQEYILILGNISGSFHTIVINGLLSGLQCKISQTSYGLYVSVPFSGSPAIVHGSFPPMTTVGVSLAGCVIVFALAIVIIKTTRKKSVDTADVYINPLISIK